MTVSRALCLLFLIAPAIPAANAQGTADDYERARTFAERMSGKVYRNRVEAHWLPGGSRFWYRVTTGPDAAEFVLVDADAGSRGPAFDHAKVAEALTAAGIEAAPNRLPFRSLSFPDASSVAFRAGGKSWRWSQPDGPLAPVDPANADSADDGNRTSNMTIRFRRSRNGGERVGVAFVNELDKPVGLIWIDGDGERHDYGTVAPKSTRELSTFARHVWLLEQNEDEPLAVIETPEDGGTFLIDGPGKRDDSRPRGRRRGGPEGGRTSPDGSVTVVARDHNLFFRGAEGEPDRQVTTNGSEERFYPDRIVWAPDSSRLVAVRIAKGQDHPVHTVESSPRDRVEPRLHTRNYLKPGDTLPKPVPVIVSADGLSQRTVDDALFPNPFTEDGSLDIRWSPDSREFYFIYNQRGHQVWRIVGVDAATGSARTVVEETSNTFIDYSGKTWLHWIDATRELLRLSECDGWAHIYLYDVAAGRLKNRVTQGEWVVRSVESVDEGARSILFMASGLRPGEDPYHLHLCRVNFDGSGFVRLTDGDGTHRVAFSPDRRWFIDEWSRVDLPPVHELRETETGRLVCELERADWSDLLAAGWTIPERIAAKARDGKTDIYGILVRPSNLDLSRKWPVLEQVYAGPQSAFVPKAFDIQARAHAMAEHGFVWVQADGMGTNHRGKAFHDVCWKNLADAGFPDRIAWIRTAATTRPWMDLENVGIYGGSAGGQNAMRALLDHNDFYSAAAADCGCHDNRMDKIWWNEQWMGWPVDESYERSSNVADAGRLNGHLLLTVGELDTNVDPASTYQVVDALIRANKPFEFLPIPGANHGAGESPYAARRRIDFFVRHLLHTNPPP